MATNKIEKITTFEKGTSNTNGLKALFGEEAQASDPKAILYEWSEGGETSGLTAGVVGNDDFPEGFNINFTDAPKIDPETGHFAPDIRSPGEGITEHPEVGQFGDTVAADLESVPQAVKDVVNDHASDGSNGATTSPRKTSVQIAQQTIGELLTGKSYADSGNE